MVWKGVVTTKMVVVTVVLEAVVWKRVVTTKKVMVVTVALSTMVTMGGKGGGG